MNAEDLLKHYARISEMPDAIPKLRRFVLDLAVRGKLVEQDAADEPASDLLKRIAAERARLMKAGTHKKLKTAPVFSLPNGWSWTSLDEISLRLHYGYTASANAELDEVRLLRITDIQDSRVNWESVPGCIIDQKSLPKYLLEVGDLLIARTGGTIGKTFLVSETPVKAVFASYLIRVQPSHELLDQYVKAFCETDVYWDQLRDGSRGGGQPNVNGQTLGKMAFPLPPLAEQHRIVAKVDELMALCDRLGEARTAREAVRDRLTAASLARLTAPETAQAQTGESLQTGTGSSSAPAASTNANFQSHARFALHSLPALTTRPDQIKPLRQTILNLAVRGKLVKQDPADEPAAELLRLISNERKDLAENEGIKIPGKTRSFDDGEPPFEIPENWIWGRLGELVLHSDAGWSPQTLNHARVGAEWGVLKVSAVSWGNFDPEANKQVLPGTEPRLQAKVREGDFLISRANTAELVARAVLVEAEPENLMMSDKIVRLRMAEVSNKRFIWMVNNRPDYARAHYAENATGVSPSMKNVSRQAILDLPVPLPPLAEQHRIVAKVDALMTLCDRLEASLTTADTTRQRLLTALLHEALGGQSEVA